MTTTPEKKKAADNEEWIPKAIDYFVKHYCGKASLLKEGKGVFGDDTMYSASLIDITPAELKKAYSTSNCVRVKIRHDIVVLSIVTSSDGSNRILEVDKDSMPLSYTFIGIYNPYVPEKFVDDCVKKSGYSKDWLNNPTEDDPIPKEHLMSREDYDKFEKIIDCKLKDFNKDDDELSSNGKCPELEELIEKYNLNYEEE